MNNTPETDEFYDKWDWYNDHLEAIDLAKKLERERNDLRKIFPQILEGLGNGSVCANDSCIEFLQDIPKEVKIVVKNLKRERNEARESLTNLLDALDKYGSGQSMNHPRLTRAIIQAKQNKTNK